jgi:hypothetical protein
LAAAVFYLFGRARFGEPVHPYVGDMHWTILALLFARRLFERGRWRDAFGLAAALVLQAGTSVYPVLATAIVGLPFAFWLLLRHPVDRRRLGQLVLVTAVLGLAAACVAVPYLHLESAGELPQVEQIFLRPDFFLPGGQWFQGWTRYVSALVAGEGAGERERSCSAACSVSGWPGARSFPNGSASIPASTRGRRCRSGCRRCGRCARRGRWRSGSIW